MAEQLVGASAVGRRLAARAPALTGGAAGGSLGCRGAGRRELPVDGRELRELCLALRGTGEEFPFGDEVSVFKVGGKCSPCAASTPSRCS